MSFDALPNELLEKIFTYFPWNELKNLSLVNRRWYRVSGSTRLTKGISLPLDATPNNVLRGSERKYQHFSCSIGGDFRSDDLIERVQGERLEYCVERWNVKSLQIHSRYDRLLRFLYFERNLFEGLVELYLTIGNDFAGELSFLPTNHQIVLRMDSLQKLHWRYSSSLDSSQCTKHRLVLVTPQLKRLELEQYYIELAEAGIWTRMNVSSALDHLEELYLNGVHLNPNEYPIVLPHLKKLTLQYVVANASLELETPRLNTLVTDFYSFKVLWLENFSSLRHIEFHVCHDCPNLHDDNAYLYFDPYKKHVTKLTLVGEAEGTPFEKFSYLLEVLPKIESLHLHQLTLPSSMDQGGPHLKKILITDCTTQAKALSFPPGAEWVRVHRLIGYNGEICVHPFNKHPPLDSVAIPSRWYQLTRRATHSTRGFKYHPEDDKLSTKFDQHNHEGVDIQESILMTPCVEITPTLIQTD